MALRGLNFLGRKQVTISIEGASLRVLACQGRRVQAWASLPLPPNLLRNGFVANSAALAEVLSLALQDKELNGRQVVISLPGLQTMSRVITLPPAPGVRPASVLPREIRRLMPQAEANSYVQWQALPSAGPRKQFFVLAVPKEPVLNLVEALALAKLKAEAMDIRPLALARAVNQEEAIVACLENTTIEVVIVRGNIPLVWRSLLLGEEPVTPEEALPRFLDELGRSLSFYNSTYRDNPMPSDLPIHLCGALSLAPEVAPAVEEALGRPTLRPRPPLLYPAHFPVEEFTVNVGLALKAL